MSIINNNTSITDTMVLSNQPLYNSHDNMNVMYESPVNTGSYVITTADNTGPIYRTSSTPWITTSVTDSTLRVAGDAEIEGNLKVGGKDIINILEKLEERLAILSPNTELEERWTELKELGRRYKELEQDILAKEKVYNILKK